ncbi:hypothetical protein EYF80_053282 [Liparis tanakae]|uniref:Uncharacterized protein n=1 Tax=Liparis tanakae TaxID=230148 RepID=A0A4Z2F655_9TELE|nr:hypothetical protein EYF80_053282 [Liparis tanakae]
MPKGGDWVIVSKRPAEDPLPGRLLADARVGARHDHSLPPDGRLAGTAASSHMVPVRTIKEQRHVLFSLLVQPHGRQRGASQAAETTLRLAHGTGLIEVQR